MMDKEVLAAAVKAIVYEMRQERLKRRVTQRTIAARMGTNQGQVASLELKNQDPKLSTLLRYADALNCELIVMAVPRVRSGE